MPLKSRILCTLCLLVTTTASARDDAAPMNVLFLTVDALRADRLGCYGYERPILDDNTDWKSGSPSPYIDAFAQNDATLFRNTTGHSAWTVPGVVSMLTGQHPAVHGMDTRHKMADVYFPTALKALQDAGYETYGYVSEGDAFGNLGLAEKQYEFVRPKVPALLERFQDRPFVMWYHLKRTHLPYGATLENQQKFARPDSPKLTQHHTNLITTLSFIVSGDAEWDPSERPAIDDLYDACVYEQDAELGKIFQKMRDLDLWENTIIVLTADHGEELAEHGEVGHASTTKNGTLYDEILRIPMMIRVPGIEGGRIIDSITQQFDSMPTVWAALGHSPRSEFQGMNLLPHIRGEATATRTYAFSETTPCGWQCTTSRDKTTRIKSVRDDRWKFIRRTDPRVEPSETLYDLATDPEERRNVAADHPKVTTQMRAALAGHEADNLNRTWAIVEGILEARTTALKGTPPEERDIPAACDALAMLHNVYRGQNPSVFDAYKDQWDEHIDQFLAVLGPDAESYWGCNLP